MSAGLQVVAVVVTGTTAFAAPVTPDTVSVIHNPGGSDARMVHPLRVAD